MSHSVDIPSFRCWWKYRTENDQTTMELSAEINAQLAKCLSSGGAEANLQLMYVVVYDRSRTGDDILA